MTRVCTMSLHLLQNHQAAFKVGKSTLRHHHWTLVFFLSLVTVYRALCSKETPSRFTDCIQTPCLLLNNYLNTDTPLAIQNTSQASDQRALFNHNGQRALFNHNGSEDKGRP